jgi:hypothetical protein
MLLACSAYGFDALKVELGILQSGEDEVDGGEPHGYWCNDFSIDLITMDAFIDLEAREICIEVDFDLVDDLEIGVDNDCFRILAAAIRHVQTMFCQKYLSIAV